MPPNDNMRESDSKYFKINYASLLFVSASGLCSLLSFQLVKEKLFQTNLMCEKLQIKMYKIILGVNAKTTNSGLKSELGRFPMPIFRFCRLR